MVLYILYTHVNCERLWSARVNTDYATDCIDYGGCQNMRTCDSRNVLFYRNGFVTGKKKLQLAKGMCALPSLISLHVIARYFALLKA